MKAILTIFLVSIFSSLTDGDSPDLIERYPALEPYFSIPVETAVPEAGGYLGGQYYKIQIEGTDRVLAAAEGAEVVTVPAYTGAPEQLWRIEQLVDGTWRIMPKSVPGTDLKYVLTSVADSTPTLAEYDFSSDNCKWNFIKK